MLDSFRCENSLKPKITYYTILSQIPFYQWNFVSDLVESTKASILSGKLYFWHSFSVWTLWWPRSSPSPFVWCHQSNRLVCNYAITQSGLRICPLKNSMSTPEQPPNHVWYRALNISAQRWPRKSLEVEYVSCSVRVSSSEMARRQHRDISAVYCGRKSLMFVLGVGMGWWNNFNPFQQLLLKCHRKIGSSKPGIWVVRNPLVARDV
jgi:hypothetical protein